MLLKNIFIIFISIPLCSNAADQLDRQYTLPLSELTQGSHDFDGEPEQFDNLFMKGDLGGLIKFCNKISLNEKTSFKISFITDDPKIVEIINQKRIANSFFIKKGKYEKGVLFYRFDEKIGNNTDADKYLAISWEKIANTWFLDSAITTSYAIKVLNK